MRLSLLEMLNQSFKNFGRVWAKILVPVILEPDSSGEESQTKVSDSLVASLPQNDMFKSRVNGIDILGWEFAFDLNETAVQHAAANKVDLKFKKIPHEVLEKKAVEQGDIHFFELAALSVKSKVKGKELELTLKDFIIPPDDVPQGSAVGNFTLVTMDRLLGS